MACEVTNYFYITRSQLKSISTISIFLLNTFFIIN